MQAEQEEGCLPRVEKRIIDLSNQLLKHFKLGRIAFLLVKVLEYLQLIYFVMRAQSQYHWNFSFISYFSMFLNFTSLDSLLRNQPTLFSSLLYAVSAVFLVVFLLGLLVGVYVGWGKKVPMFVRVSIPVLNFTLYLCKTIFAIPTMHIILVGLIPTIAKAYNIVNDSPITILALSIVLVGSFLILQIYILVIFRQSNPFSELPHAGESFLHGLIWLLFKLALVVYSLLDTNGNLEGPSSIIFTLLIICLIIYGHFEIGLYKHFEKMVEIRLLYVTLIFGFLQSVDYYGQNQATSLSYLVPMLLLIYLFSEWILAWQRRRTAALTMVFITTPEQLEYHVLYLIGLIDTMERRQCRIALEGYMNYHRRECRLAEECPCFKLGLIRERDEETIKLQFFKLVVTLLNEGRRKYPYYKKIDLLLGLLYHYRIKNHLQAIYAITKTVTNRKFDLVDQLYKSYYLQRVQEDMIELDEKQVSHTSEINRYLQYTNKLVHFEEQIESCTKHHIEFWRLMLDSNPEIKRLEDLGSLITRSKDSLRQEFQSIFESSPNSVHLLTIYGKFLLQVTNEESYNVKYLQKAETILKNMKESSKIDDAGSKYSENSQTGLVVISGDEGQLGTIVHTNNLVKRLLGYKRAELVDRNVALIMPRIYGDQHNAVLSRYIGASESKVNGHERVVPALNKQGFMMPATALTKALPTLNNGIQIVAFLAKLQERYVDEDDSNFKVNYILYRTDTEQILGISEGCYTDFHINPCLVYGNPYNINNELRIKNLFGLSFQRTEEGKIAAALEQGQVFMTLNTRNLKDQFIITRPGSSKDEMIEFDQQQSIKQGIEAQVAVRNVLSTLYFGISLKLIAVYPKRVVNFQRNLSKRNDPLIKVKKADHDDKRDKQMKMLQDTGRTETDDMKNLKDFKNFISIKSEPSAITAISTICICMILLISASIVGLIFNWLQVHKINSNMLSLYRLTLQTELAAPEILVQLEEQLMARSAASYNITNFTSEAIVSAQLGKIIKLAKEWQLSVLPFKFFFNTDYSQTALEYRYDSKGVISSSSLLLEEVMANYMSQVETVVSGNSSALTSNFSSNRYQKYSSAKLNEIYSLRSSLNSSNEVSWGWYGERLTSRKAVIIGVHSLMVGVVLLWLILLLPYVLSVTKINNRVLSLFTLIPYSEICKLIYCSLNFLTNNLTEANINLDDLKYYDGEQNSPSRMNDSNLNSPSQYGLLSGDPYTQSSMVKRPSEGGRGGMDSVVGVEEKFEKMINSEDGNKKVVIIKFVGISLAILAFILFYLFYSLSAMDSVRNNLSNYYTLARRPALIRNIKLLLAEYLLAPTYQPAGFPSIRSLNQAAIQQFYNLEATLLFLDLGSYQSIFTSYNNADVCLDVAAFSTLSLFQETMTAAECYSVKSRVLQKGLKTGIVSVLEDIRSLLSQYPSAVPRQILASKMMEYDILVKYIEAPMLAILQSAHSSIDKMVQQSELTIILSGSIFLGLVLLSWRLVWLHYLSQLNVKIWRTKGLLNLIPMRIITANDLLKNEFTSGQLENAVR